MEWPLYIFCKPDHGQIFDQNNRVEDFKTFLPMLKHGKNNLIDLHFTFPFDTLFFFTKDLRFLCYICRLDTLVTNVNKKFVVTVWKCCVLLLLDLSFPYFYFFFLRSRMARLQLLKPSPGSFTEWGDKFCLTLWISRYSRGWWHTLSILRYGGH